MKMEIDNTTFLPRENKKGDIQPFSVARELTWVPVAYAIRNMQAWQCLSARGIRSISELLKLSPEQIGKTENLGKKLSDEVCEIRAEILRDPNFWFRKLRKQYKVIYLSDMVPDLPPYVLVRLAL